MFTILGSDGKEYGPASADQLRAWIAAGRVDFETKAKPAGSDTWQTVGELPEFSIDENVPPPLPADSTVADRGSRLLAKLMDEVLALACALPGGLILGFSVVKTMLTTGDIGQLGNVDSGRIFLGVGLLAMAMLALTIVQIWLLVTRGQTIGKWILGIRIVRQTDGGKADFGHVWALRSLLPGFIGFLPYLGMIFTLADVFFIFRADRRCLHDLMADTKVVKV